MLEPIVCSILSFPNFTQGTRQDLGKEGKLMFVYYDIVEHCIKCVSIVFKVEARQKITNRRRNTAVMIPSILGYILI